MKFWPVIGYLVALTVSGVWWGATTQAQVQQLQHDQQKTEQIVDDIPDIKATVKNIERLLERLDRSGSFQGR